MFIKQSCRIFCRLLKTYLRLTKSARKFDSSGYPIKIYEPLIPITSSELQALRRAYWQELQLDSHPLFDLYFLQIAHAQTIGYPEEINLKRQLLSVGRATFKTIDIWRQLLFGNAQEGKEYILGSRPLTNEDKSLREFLRLIVERYFREDWRDVVSDVVDLGVDFGLTIAQTGVLGWRDAVIQIVLLRGKKLVVESLTETNSPLEKRVFKGALGSFLIFFVCLLLIASPVLSMGLIKLFFSSTDEEITLPQIIITVTKDLLPTATSYVTPSPIIEPIITIESPSVTEIPMLVTAEVRLVNEEGGPSYCMYVVQPGDSIQSVASRFNVTEQSIQTQNPHVAAGVFVINQAVMVNSPCCTPIGGKGFSYTVQKNDNLYSLSRTFSTSIEAVASANNLHAPWYIQTGQMLCIPFP
ncbi:MAG: LysM peptidoglycan-binding domain-containing protein [Chloroflexi bacterium]|nr:LysM peptidoglycan-binding domain-containing protein [Chloroflexota bacterium]